MLHYLHYVHIYILKYNWSNVNLLYSAVTTILNFVYEEKRYDATFLLLNLTTTKKL